MLQILLIEDNPSDILLIQEGIRRSQIPVEVTVASDGEQALNFLAGSHFDLVILDLSIPKFTGHFILDQHRFRNGPPITVFSGSDNPTDREIALAFGAKDYIVKPQEFLQFIEAVKKILERRKSACA